MLDLLRMAFALALIVIPGIFINVLEVLTLLVRPFSLRRYRELNRDLVSLHWPLLVWLIEGWAGVRLKLYGDKLPANETMIGILNHRSDVDWMIGFALCGRKCILGALKVIVKTAHLMIPVFGLMEYFVEFIFVKRNWQEDKAALERGLLSLQAFPKPFWFIIFPEGTRYSQKRKEANQSWARENGKTPLEHVLWPRAKAFVMATQTLKGTADAIYDATMIFEKEVTFFDLLKGRGNTVVHFHVKRYDMAQVADKTDGVRAFCLCERLFTERQELEAWLDERWLEKERLFEVFSKHSSFLLPELENERPMKSHYFVVAWIAFTLCSLLVILRSLPPISWDDLKHAFFVIAGLTFVGILMLISVLRQTSASKKKSQ